MPETSRTSPPTPALLRAARPIALLASVLAGLAALAIYRGSPYDTATIEAMGGRGLFFVRAVFAITLLSAVTLFLIYRGLSTRRHWARPLVVVFWLLAQAAALLLPMIERSTQAVWSADLTPTIGLVVSIGYLYFKSNVRSYFAALPRPRTTESVA